MILSIGTIIIITIILLVLFGKTLLNIVIFVVIATITIAIVVKIKKEKYIRKREIEFKKNK